MLRIKGELLILQGEDAPAEEHFMRAFELAELQDARAWQLRSAISLAQVLRADRAAKARERLSGVLARFSEGFATSDLQAAKQIVAEL